jgi:hypothetical protein
MKRGLVILVLGIVFLMGSVSGATVFKSGFEDPVVMSNWISGTNWYKETTGADQGYDWETDFITTDSFWNIILNKNTYPNPDECIGLDIITEEHHSGSKALYVEVKKSCKYSSVEARVSHSLEVTWPYDEAHFKAWIKIPSSSETALRGDGGTINLNELRNPENPDGLRIVFDILSNSGASLQFRIWSELWRESGWQPHWIHIAEGVTVPIDQWFQYEVYYYPRTYAQGGGAYWIKVNGVKILEQIPTSTKRICGATASDATCAKPFAWNMIKCYTYDYPVKAYLDDIELYNTLTSSSCIENWQCTSWSAWSECVNNLQSRTRTCTDLNSCGTTISKPSEIETQSCSITPTTNYSILKTNSAPTIDGNLNEFADANPITITNSRGTTGIYKLMWDSNALYLAAEFSDDKLNADLAHQEDDSIYSDDSLEIMFDTLNNGGTSMQTDDYKFFVNVNNIHTDSQKYDTSWDSGITKDVLVSGTINNDADTDTGYVIEVRIPWAGWVSAPVNEAVWGMNVQLNDKIETGTTQTQWSESGLGVNVPDGWNEVVFSSETIGSICGASDSNSDGIVTISELIDYIGEWKIGNVPIDDLIDAIGKWKSGC